MENNYLDDNIKSGSVDVGLNLEGLEYLRQAGKWGKFLAILGFIFCGLIALVGLFAASSFNTISSMSGTPIPMAGLGGLLTFVYLLIAALYFFPCLSLFRFSTNAIEAANSKNSEHVTEALKNLKSNFKFVGIIAIIGISFYLLIFVFAIFMAAMR